MSHLRDGSQGKALGVLGDQPHHDLAHGPWPSWDVYTCIEPSFPGCACLIPS